MRNTGRVGPTAEEEACSTSDTPSEPHAPKRAVHCVTGAFAEPGLEARFGADCFRAALAGHLVMVALLIAFDVSSVVAEARRDRPSLAVRTPAGQF